MEENFNEDSKVNIVKKVMEAFKVGDIKTVIDSLADDVIWIVPFTLSDPYGGLYKGKEAILTLFKTFGQSVELLEYNVEKYIASEDTIIVSGNKKLKYLANQRKRNIQFLYRIDLESDKIRLFDTFQREHQP